MNPLVGSISRALVLGPLTMCLTIVLASAQPQDSQRAVMVHEDDIKAAFIYHFAQFVEWPPDVLGPSAITIEVVADEGLARSLSRVAEGNTAQGRRLVVRHQPESCHWPGVNICVISGDDDTLVGLRLDRVRDHPVLTVGESRRFLDLGGIIRLRLTDNPLRFDISRDAATRGGLRISAKLLALGSQNRGGAR